MATKRSGWDSRTGWSLEARRSTRPLAWPTSWLGSLSAASARTGCPPTSSGRSHTRMLSATNSGAAWRSRSPESTWPGQRRSFAGRVATGPSDLRRRRGGRMRRVVATGLGVVSPLGIGIDAFWDHLSRGVSGVRRITKFNAAGLPSQIAGEVAGFDAEMYLARRDIVRTDTFVHFALKIGRAHV